jgi:arylsulfatase
MATYKEQKMPDLPNILLIHTEHHRGDSLGCENHPVLLTPNMDTIAYKGARFTRFYTACPSCIATRKSILVGQLPQTHGMVGYRDGLEWDGIPTLPGILRANGYQTVHLGRSMHQYPPRKRYGFDHMETNLDYNEWLRDNDHTYHGVNDWFSGGVMHNDWTVHPWHFDEAAHQTNWTIERALHFMQTRDPSCPFFMSLGFISAHPPFQPPPFYFERYLRTGVPDAYIGDWAKPPQPNELGDEDLVSANRINLPPEAFRAMRAAYYGLLNHVDDQLRRLINPVTGLRHDNTIIIFTSDHGEMLGDHYRFRKYVAYEGSARVPFLFCAPPRFGINKMSIIDAPSTHADIMPTILDMLRIAIPESVDGLSLYPWLRGEKPENWREFLHIEHAPYHHGLTDGRDKYIWNPGDGNEQLFDLTADPHELHDRAADKDAAERLRFWRERLMARLEKRPEGFVENGKLVPGKPYPPIIKP